MSLHYTKNRSSVPEWEKERVAELYPFKIENNEKSVRQNFAVPTSPAELQEWDFDPDGLPRDISAVNLEIVTKDKVQSRHSHRKAQLIVPLRGLISCEVDNALWIVPSANGLWIPSEAIHRMRSAGNVSLYVLFIEPGVCQPLPAQCGTIPISPLLCELIGRLSTFPLYYEVNERNDRLTAMILDELMQSPVNSLNLPMPSDPRLRRIARELMQDSSNRLTAAEWASRVGMSERTMFRLMSLETGMTFGRWKRQLHILLALERLADGDAVQTIALDLGYESASSFITMFRKTFGISPTKFIATRNSGPDSGTHRQTN